MDETLLLSIEDRVRNISYRSVEIVKDILEALEHNSLQCLIDAIRTAQNIEWLADRALAEIQELSKEFEKKGDKK